MDFYASRIRESLALKEAVLQDAALLDTLEQVGRLWIETFRRDGKILFCGNGGSAADAQHIAAELSGPFYLDRAPLYAEALHVNGSYLTAVGNDYGYAHSYERMVRAAGREGDVLVAISTSGNSENIVLAARAAKERGMSVVGLTGEGGGALASLCDHLLAVPSKTTPRIQEIHILLGHLLCERTEAALFGPEAEL